MLKTAEAVSLGHPDKTADFISEYILDRVLEQDCRAKYAVEVMVKDSTVVLGGTSCIKASMAAFVLRLLRDSMYFPS